MAILFALLMVAGLLVTWRALTADEAEPAPTPGPAAAEPPPARLAAWLARAGLGHLSPRRFLGLSALTGLGLALLALLLTGWPVLAVVGAVAGPAVLAGYYDRRAAARERQALLDLELALGQLRGLIATSLGLTHALAELAARGPAGLRPAFAEAGRAARLQGLPAGVATLRATVGEPADDLVEALTVAVQAGEDRLPLVLAQLEANLRGLRQTREAITTAQHRAVLQARFLAAAPLVVLLGMRLVSPEFTAVYDTRLGAAALLVIAGLVGAGYVMMLRAGRIARSPRPRRTV